MARFVRWALSLAMLLVACDDVRQPTEIEDVLSDGPLHVTMTLVDDGGFPDRVVRYELVVARFATRRSLVRGRRQVQDVAHHARASRIDGLVAVALDDDLWLLGADVRSSVHLDVDAVEPDARATGVVADALAWWAGQGAMGRSQR